VFVCMYSTCLSVYVFHPSLRLSLFHLFVRMYVF
jgi:hypothetical protein